MRAEEKFSADGHARNPDDGGEAQRTKMTLGNRIDRATYFDGYMVRRNDVSHAWVLH